MRAGITLFAGLCAALAGLACAPVPGEGRFVHIDAEEAIILWDELAKRQHFIRRASFETDARDFGFLVPSPGKPDLDEADDGAFKMLREITAPITRERAKGEHVPKGERAAAAAVTVLEQKVVAGFDAAVLEATDADALYRWLKEHGYRSDPHLVEWTRPYIERNWKITAFKISGDSPRVSTKAVRMSFQAERPFFPYREPGTQRVAGKEKRDRLLRVYLVADARFDGAIGEKGAWPGKAVWSNTLETPQLAQLLKLANLPPMAGGGGRRLTEFEDRSSPRPGTDDVFFTRAADQATIERSVAQPQSSRSSSSGGSYAAVAGLAALVLLAAAIGYGLWWLFRGYF